MSLVRVTRRCLTVLPLLLVACAPPPVIRRESREPDMRVGLLVGVPEVKVGGRGEDDVTASAAGTTAFRINPGSSVTIVPDGDGVALRGGSTANPSRFQSLAFQGAGELLLTVNGKAYRGSLDVIQRKGRLTVINRVSLESYLASVVTAEMGRRRPDEIAALEAQAVVSRTYALRSRARAMNQDYDLMGTVADQAYSGVETEDRLAIDAVRATTGRALTYRGELIKAFFHSTCGSATASPDEVFRTVQPEPYLRSVSDRRSGGYYCDISPRFRWSVEWDQRTLAELLRKSATVLGVSAADLAEVRDVQVRRTGPSGRATEIAIRGSGPEIRVRGPDIRTVFLTPEGRPLGSTAIQITSRHEDRGEVFVASGAGWGHGVGMCQWGAIGRARAGQDYGRILSSYFPGTEVERWY